MPCQFLLQLNQFTLVALLFEVLDECLNIEYFSLVFCRGVLEPFHVLPLKCVVCPHLFEQTECFWKFYSLFFEEFDKFQYLPSHVTFRILLFDSIQFNLLIRLLLKLLNQIFLRKQLKINVVDHARLDL